MERLLCAYKDAAVLTDKEGRTALHCAAVGGSSESIERFMAASANIYRKDRNGRTALHMAAACAQLNAVLTLMQFGAQVNALDNNDCTPLHLASAAGAADKDGRVLEALLMHHADPCLATVEQATWKQAFLVTAATVAPRERFFPLHFAAVSGHRAATERLMKVMPESLRDQ